LVDEETSIEPPEGLPLLSFSAYVAEVAKVTSTAIPPALVLMSPLVVHVPVTASGGTVRSHFIAIVIDSPDAVVTRLRSRTTWSPVTVVIPFNFELGSSPQSLKVQVVPLQSQVPSASITLPIGVDVGAPMAPGVTKVE